MEFKRTTQVPNLLFDTYVPKLSLAELRVLLIIIRQTNGWIDPRTGKRKVRDRISHSQFSMKTNLSRRILTTTIQALIDKGLVVVTDTKGNILSAPRQRKGRQYLYYGITIRLTQTDADTYAVSIHRPVHQSAHNKTKKRNETKNQKAVIEIVDSVTKTIQDRI